MNFLKDGLSIKETRISVMIVGLISALIIAYIQIFNVGDISENLLILIQWFIGAISGINIANSVSHVVKNNSTSLPEEEEEYKKY